MSGREIHHHPATILLPLRSLSCTTLAAAALLLVVAPPSADAAFVITLQQFGNDVVANGSGTFNTTALTLDFNSGGSSFLIPSSSAFIFGPDVNTPHGSWLGMSGPSSFGTGGQTFSSIGSGAPVGRFGGSLILPQGYVSGTPLTNSTTWTNKTLATLGVTPGTYTWTWGTGPTADSMTIQAVPEPGSALLLALGTLGLLARRRR